MFTFTAQAGQLLFLDNQDRDFDALLLELRDPQGELLLTRVLRAGDSFRVPDRSGLQLVTGNAGGLAISVDGAQVPDLGPVGAVRRGVELDPDSLKAGTAGNL